MLSLCVVDTLVTYVHNQTHIHFSEFRSAVLFMQVKKKALQGINAFLLFDINFKDRLN